MHIGTTTLETPFYIIIRCFWLLKVYVSNSICFDSNYRRTSSVRTVKIDQIVTNYWCWNLNISASRHFPDLFSCLKIISSPVFITIKSYISFTGISIDVWGTPSRIFIALGFPELNLGFHIISCHKRVLQYITLYYQNSIINDRRTCKLPLSSFNHEKD